MEDVYKMAFARVSGMSIRLARQMLEIIPDERSFFELSESDLAEVCGATHRILGSDYRKKLLQKAYKELDFLQGKRIQPIYMDEAEFPRRLLDVDDTGEISDAPIMLYKTGDCNLNAKHVISIVGTRNATDYGKRITQKLVADLKEILPDIIIVSGLAYGIDVAAHRASIECGLPTVGVLAHGLNTIYPATHRSVAKTMATTNGGALISEYTSQDPIFKYNFLARNRIVAGMSDCTIVVESASHGGALVTARIANSYGRDVFAVPGRIGDRFSEGCNKIINNQVAVMVTSAEELVKSMNWEQESMIAKPMQKTLFPVYTKEEQPIIDLLTEKGELHSNDIAKALKMPIHKLLSLLTDMEYDNHIHILPNGKYVVSL